MPQNRFLSFVRQSFQGFAWTLLISTCLAAIILIVTIVSLRGSPEKIRLRHCSQQGFVYDLNFIAPIQLGVSRWQVGDHARYLYKRTQSATHDNLTQEVSFHIISELEKSGSHGYWLKKAGFYLPLTKAIPADIYRWVTFHDLRITPQKPVYEYPLNYFPYHHIECQQTSIPLAKLVKQGKEEIKTQAGVFECIHYRAELEWNHKKLEIWASPAVPPLGIVRVQSQTESLELISFGQETEIILPRLIKPLIEGISTLEHGCNSCHGDDDCHEMFFPPK